MLLGYYKKADMKDVVSALLARHLADQVTRWSVTPAAAACLPGHMSTQDSLRIASLPCVILTPPTT
jgi:hypothetical protein